jgi:hypothetical protein
MIWTGHASTSGAGSGRRAAARTPRRIAPGIEPHEMTTVALALFQGLVQTTPHGSEYRARRSLRSRTAPPLRPPLVNQRSFELGGQSLFATFRPEAGIGTRPGSGGTSRWGGYQSVVSQEVGDSASRSRCAATAARTVLQPPHLRSRSGSAALSARARTRGAGYHPSPDGDGPRVPVLTELAVLGDQLPSCLDCSRVDEAVGRIARESGRQRDCSVGNRCGDPDGAHLR